MSDCCWSMICCFGSEFGERLFLQVRCRLRRGDRHIRDRGRKENAGVPHTWRFGFDLRCLQSVQSLSELGTALLSTYEICVQ